MSEMITLPQVKEYMALPGRARGVTFLTDLSYVREKKGEEGIQRLKKKLQEWGVGIEYEKIENIEWYPVGWRLLSLLAIKEVFDLSDKEVFDIGYNAPTASFLVRILMQHFVSLKRTTIEAPKYWIKHYTVGTLEIPQIDEEKKHLIVRLKDFRIHPIMCAYCAGYFQRIVSLNLGDKNVSIEELKCIHKGDDAHEFFITWK